MMTPAELLVRFDTWAETRNALGELESETGEFDADDWHASDDDAVDLAEWLAASLREVLAERDSLAAQVATLKSTM